TSPLGWLCVHVCPRLASRQSGFFIFRAPTPRGVIFYSPRVGQRVVSSGRGTWAISHRGSRRTPRDNTAGLQSNFVPSEPRNAALDAEPLAPAAPVGCSGVSRLLVGPHGSPSAKLGAGSATGDSTVAKLGARTERHPRSEDLQQDQQLPPRPAKKAIHRRRQAPDM